MSEPTVQSTRPLIINRPRLRFVEGAPDGGVVEPPKPSPPAPVAPTAATDPIQLPDDHPLVKTLAAQKELIAGLKTKASRLDEIEEAQKTEAQKLADRVAAAEKEATEARIEAAKSRIAAAKGVPEELLTGSTPEELSAAADKLLAFKGTTPAAPPATPQGAVGSPINGSDPDIDAAIKAAQEARNFPLVATLKQQKAAKQKAG